MGLVQNTRIACIVTAFLLASIASAQPRHGIAMYGDPALPPDFTALPYANPDAPKGGRIVQGEVGSFDSLNPFILKGNPPWQMQFLVYESLMGRNYDEPFTLYGLLAESVETAPDRSWVEFTLRPEATFSDGTPVTVDDVLWSFETLGTEGHPRFHGAWQKVASAERTGERTVRFTFNERDDELPLIMGLRPILKKAQWDGKDFSASGLNTVPVGSGPYVIGDYEAGRYVTLLRDKDYWGADLPLRRGTGNLDEVRMEFFGDGTVMFEAFKGGLLNTMRETNAKKWATQYDFPAIRSGDVVKSEIHHQRPSGITGLVMNTRRAPFDDWRVREAMILAFNFEFINQTLNGGNAPRITSYFSNSDLGMLDGAATGRTADLLAPFADTLLPGTLDGYEMPVSDGTERNRRNTARALDLLAEAGWQVGPGGTLRNADGEPFEFTILLNQGDNESQQVVDLYAAALKRLGIAPRILSVDSAQYVQRTQEFDFDMTWYTRALSLSPGNEQKLYWGEGSADTPGSRNWMGADDPAIDAMIDAMLTSETPQDFVAATRALDRLLTAGRYVIPIWHNPVSWIAHDARLHYPPDTSIYGDWIGFQPDVWWWQD
ncbi:extracellular solute-binding protein [Oceaniovalibus guishaninsula]|nr:extracellular solute-binding protein [Oceaniovalibus guishaninsula]